jgi:hypothetical protein
MGTGKAGSCRCRPEITIETAQGNVRVMDDGTICLPATSN